MNPGDLDSRADFEKLVSSSDGGGGTTSSWELQFSRWSALALPSMRAQQEAIAAGAVQSTTGGTLTVREDLSTRLITAQWRVWVKGRVWNIREVRPSNRTGYLRMSVETGVST